MTRSKILPEAASPKARDRRAPAGGTPTRTTAAPAPAANTTAAAQRLFGARSKKLRAAAAVSELTDASLTPPHDDAAGARVVAQKPAPLVSHARRAPRGAAVETVSTDAKIEAEAHDAGAAPAAPKTALRAGTKQEAVVAMLKRPHGVTLATIMAATGWQEHSVRGFLAAVVRKKLGLTLASEKTDDGRVYSVVTQDEAPPRKEKTRRKAT